MGTKHSRKSIKKTGVLAAYDLTWVQSINSVLTSEQIIPYLIMIKQPPFLRKLFFFTHSLISVLLLSESGFHPVPDLMVG